MAQPHNLVSCGVEEISEAPERDLIGRANGTLDSWYGLRWELMFD